MLRMIIQLSILGVILKPIFEINSPWLVLGYASFMIVIASVEAVSRPQQTYKVRTIT
jgi:ABC-type iron transport system FetAB permease component